jgi:hypothetical protein
MKVARNVEDARKILAEDEDTAFLFKLAAHLHMTVSELEQRLRRGEVNYWKAILGWETKAKPAPVATQNKDDDFDFTVPTKTNSRRRN